MEDWDMKFIEVAAVLTLIGTMVMGLVSIIFNLDAIWVFLPIFLMGVVISLFTLGSLLFFLFIIISEKGRGFKLRGGRCR